MLNRLGATRAPANPKIKPISTGVVMEDKSPILI
jgi:hypothetical protein